MRSGSMLAWISAVAVAFACAQPGASATLIVSVEGSASGVGRYEWLEVTLRIEGRCANPYDPDEIAVEGHFVGPDGGEVIVPGFYHAPYRNASEGGLTVTNPGRERWEAAGEPSFKVRFAPTEVGQYRWWIVARDAAGEVRSQEARFECVPSKSPGFIRVSPANPRAFAFASGSAFLPLGACIAWARGNAPGDDYDTYFRRLAENGCNAARVWMCHWAWLEWTRGEAGSLAGYEGVGRYNQLTAANFDRLIELAEQHGIHLMLCLNNGAWEFGRPDGKNDEYDSWGGNPYNAANGGPCATPGDFWTDPEAKRLYQRKLRYIVARWSCSPSVWAWEFWNEIGQESPETVAWHRDMADYLHAIDPNRHPVSTSSWVDTAAANRETFGLLDFSQLHYGSPDAITAMLDTVPGKPLVVGEGTCDESGVGFHNSLWASLMAGAAGPPLTWHDGPASPLETQDLYHHFRAVAEFMRGENLSAEPYEPVRLTATGGAAGADGRYAPVVLEPQFGPWLQRAPEGEFPAPPDGRVDTRGLGTKLYGSNADRAPFRNPPTFILDCPVECRFVVTVGEASGPVTVEVRVDGEVAVQQLLPGEGRRYIEGDARQVAVALPSGAHRVQVSNAGADWLQVLHYTLSAYRDRAAYPDLEVCALRGSRRVLLWAHNTSHTPEVMALGIEPSPVRGARTEITGLPDGPYTIETWDTLTADRIDSRRAECRAGRLRIDLPDIETDVALKALPLGGE